jgi:hypothetical protein
MPDPLASYPGVDDALTVLLSPAILLLAWLALRSAPAAFAITGAFFVLSLAVRALLVPYFCMAGLATVAARHRLRRESVALVLAGAGLALASRWAVPHPESAPAAADPQALVQYWLARDNGWRARGVALDWVRAEKDAPSEGYLALAQVDWDLGEHDKARRVLAHLVASSTDESLRARASRMQAAWLSP